MTSAVSPFPDPTYPPGAAELWRRCLPVTSDTGVSAYLAARALDPALIAAGDLARVLPPDDLPPWTRHGGRSWNQSGHQLVAPCFDAAGELRSLRGVRIGAGDPKKKRLAPAGHKAGGLVLASRSGIEMLGLSEGSEYERGLRVLIAEGESDLWTFATSSAWHGWIVLGVYSMSWTSDLAARIPTDARVIIATDADEAGEKYAAQIAASLGGRCTMERLLMDRPEWRREQKKYDANDAHHDGRLPGPDAAVPVRTRTPGQGIDARQHGVKLFKPSTGADDESPVDEDLERAAIRDEEASPAPAFACSDLGNAERLVARYGEKIRHCKPRRRWLVWDGRRWAWDETGAVERMAKNTTRLIFGEAMRAADEDRRKAIAKHAITSEGAARIDAMINVAKWQMGVPVLTPDLDADLMLFNVANGTIDLRTGELREHRREDLITKLSPIDFDPGAESEEWAQFLSEITGGDVDYAGYLRRVAGYCLTGLQSEKCRFFGFGPPNAGKGTFADTLTAAWGDYACAADSETWLEQPGAQRGNRGDLVRLMGMRLVTSSEVRKGAKWDEALLKRLTGGDRLTVAAKYEAEVEFVAALKLWVFANDAPKIRDDDDASWQRMHRLPFRHQPATINRQLKATLSTARVSAAVLAWAVRGCLEWQRDGLGTCEAVQASTAEYRHEMDRFVGFATDCLVFGEEGAFVPTGRLRRAYETWCKEEGVTRPLTGKEMGERLTARGANSTKRGGERIWRGVRLLQALETPDDA